MTYSIHHLTIGYDKTAPVAQITDAVLSTGQFVCLLGRNGTGKSTLLKTLAGLIDPLEEESDMPRRDLISIVLTTLPVLEHTTVRELVASGRLPYTGWLSRLDDTDWNSVDKAIQMVGIENLQDRKLNRLSDGERQKAMIARAIAQDRPLIILDEPSAFLDYPGKREMMRLLSRLAKENDKAILLSTHDVEQAIQTADKIWLLQDQKLQVLPTSPDIIETYFNISD